MARLSDPVTILKGVGPSKAKLFANLNFHPGRPDLSFSERI